ncbi:MAG: hypothetical protein D6797_09295 [Bdellovibrio sp.]|nr:MAG: hypothetical protein D6797_09295 [Bdellovibrio sp.]
MWKNLTKLEKWFKKRTYPMKLKDFQQQIFDYLSEKTLTPPRFIADKKGISREIRINSYKDSFINGVIDVIEKDYYVTCLFIHEDTNTYIKNYLKSYPPSSHFINEEGRHFPKYIKEHPPSKAPDFLYELAQMEWLMNEAFYNYYSYKKEEKTPPTKGTFLHVNPSLTFLTSSWPLDKIWNEEKPYNKKDSFITLWATEDRSIHVQGWSPLEFQVLQTLKQYPILEEAVEHLDDSASTEELTSIFSKTLPHWIQLKMIFGNENN